MKIKINNATFVVVYNDYFVYPRQIYKYLKQLFMIIKK